MKRLLAVLTLLAAGATPVQAHPLDPALLDLNESPSGVVAVRWSIPVAQPLGAAPLQPVLPATCRAATPPEVEAGDVRAVARWSLQCDAQGLTGATVGIDGLRERGTDALLRIQRADGSVTQTVLRGERDRVRLGAVSTRGEVFADYLRLGAEHILLGIDHLLFVLGLLLLVRGRRALFWTVTSFTIGHSITLALAALGLVDFPPRLMEVLIAITIVVLALELARPASERHGLMARAPWATAFAFGLLHGFGFAGALSEVGLPRHEIPAALLAFNAGIEVGQLAFIAAMVLAWAALRRLPIRWPTAARALPAYAIGSLSAYWILDRTWGMLAT